jgi:hypothetical protein
MKDLYVDPFIDDGFPLRSGANGNEWSSLVAAMLRQELMMNPRSY